MSGISGHGDDGLVSKWVSTMKIAISTHPDMMLDVART